MMGRLRMKNQAVFLSPWSRVWVVLQKLDIPKVRLFSREKALKKLWFSSLLLPKNLETGALQDNEKSGSPMLDSCSPVQEALCAFSERRKKKRDCLNGAFVVWVGRQQKHKKQWLTNTWPLCASNTSALHLIQCQQMPPLSTRVARFLSVRWISSCFHKDYCFLSRHLGEWIWHMLNHFSMRGWKWSKVLKI